MSNENKIATEQFQNDSEEELRIGLLSHLAVKNQYFKIFWIHITFTLFYVLVDIVWISVYLKTPHCSNQPHELLRPLEFGAFALLYQ